MTQENARKPGAAADRAAVVSQPLRWLTGIFLVLLVLVFALRAFFASLESDLHARGANERARLFVGEEIVLGIQGVEKNIYLMAATQNAAGFDRIYKSIDLQLNKLINDLNVLRFGGTARRQMQVNVGEQDEATREATFRPDEQSQKNVMELIEIGPQLGLIRDRVDELERLLTLRWQTIEHADRARFFRIEEEIALLLKQMPPYFERLGENANRLFLEGDQRLRGLEAELQERRDRLKQGETVLIALLLVLGGIAGMLYLRRLAAALKEARHAGDEIERQREQVATMLDTLSDGVYATDLEGRITFLNRVAEDILGWQAQKLIGREAHLSVHHTRPDGATYPREQCPLIEVLREGVSLEGEEHFVSHSGHFIPVSYRSKPLLRDGKVVGALVSFRDTSAQMASQARIRLQQAALDTAINMIVITDRNGHVEYVNPAFCKITGYTAEDVLGKKTSVLRSNVHDAEFYRALWDTLLAGKPWEGELTNRRKDGSLYQEQMSITPIVENGEAVHFIAIKRDISEETRQRKAVEEALRRTHDQALENARLKSEFLSNMSHEIRTPMNGIIGMTDLLLDTPLNPEQREFTGVVRDSAQSLLTIINDILDFSKIEAGKLEIEVTEYSPIRVVEGVIDLMAGRARGKGLSLMCLIDPDLPIWLRGDPTRLRQVLLNLVGNAVKFTERGEIQVSVRSDQNGVLHKVRFEIRDTGIGLSAAAQGRLFQSFSQADSSTTRKYGGTGLGLAICKQLVELMGGEIGIVSEEGQGSTFWFTLPLLVASMESAANPQSGIASDIEEATGTAAVVTAAMLKPDLRDALETGRLILLAEDNPTNQKVAQLQLNKLGYAVHIVGNGREAVEAADALPYAAILMDCQMPVMDGFEATAVIRKAEHSGDHIPIIAMTANAMKGDRERCIAAGMDDYVSKPIDPARLAEVLIHWVGVPAHAALPVQGQTKHIPLPVDFARLDYLSDDHDLVVELFDIFRTSMSELLEKLSAAVDRCDAIAVKALAHEIKGACGNLGVDGMAHIAADLEKVVTSADWPRVGVLRAELAATFVQVNHAIEEHF
jgi:PAS domain S-box-containing protein